MELALKQAKNESVIFKQIETKDYTDFIQHNIRSPVNCIKHPTLPGVVIVYHERQKGEEKIENFYLRDYFDYGNKVIYGNAVFIKVDDNDKISSLTESDKEKITSSFKKFEIKITKQYIQGGKHYVQSNA